MIRTFIIAILLSLASAILSAAQSSISKLVNSIEDSKGCDVIYRENRDPATRKVTYSKRLITFKNKKLAQRFEEAFRKERENSVEYQSNEDKSASVYKIRFDDNKGHCSQYTLVIEGTGHDKCTLSAEIHNAANVSKKSSRHSSSHATRTRYRR